MPINKILAEDTVSVSELRKNPGDYFLDRPVAAMKSNQAIGYMVGADLFEKMVQIIEQSQQEKSILGKFRPTTVQLKKITKASAQFLQNASDEDLGQFIE